MIETSLMVEDYPEPSEPKEKYYTLTCTCNCECEISIWAESQEDAERQVSNGDYDDITILNHDVEYIGDVECDD